MTSPVDRRGRPAYVLALAAALLLPLLAQADPVPEGGALSSGYGYDAEGRLTTVNLPKGAGQPDARQQTHRYDSLGRRTVTNLARAPHRAPPAPRWATATTAWTSSTASPPR